MCWQIGFSQNVNCRRRELIDQSNSSAYVRLKPTNVMAANLAGMAFIPYYNHIMKVLDTDEELKKSVKGIFQQMMYPAAGACVGGVVAGPPGAMIGGIAGSVYGYMTVDPYDNLIKVIRSLNDEEKAELVKRVQEMVGASTIEGLTAFLATQVNREIFASLIREFAAQKQGG